MQQRSSTAVISSADHAVGRRMVWVTFRRPGMHRWPDAPEETAYLRSPHRHVFHFRVWISVEHDDREIEFHAFLAWIESLYDHRTLNLDYRSCEMLADELYQRISARHPGREVWIEVSEDGENGSFTQYPGGAGPDMQQAASS